MMTLRATLLVQVIGLGLLLNGLAECRANEPPQFHVVVEQHFDRWAHGGKGVLTAERIEELVLRKDIHGPEAAALASIHCYQRKAKQAAHQITRAFLLANHNENGTLRRDQSASGGNLTINYKSFAKHIGTVPRKIFAVEQLNLEGISQGHLADCYFIAGVGAAAHLYPDHLRKLILARQDGSCEVRFQDGTMVHVPPLTDAQLALGSNAGNQGIWLNVLEEAAGIARMRKAPRELALDVIGSGGDSVFTIELLTGHKVTKELIRPYVKGTRPAPAEHDIPSIADRISHAIHDGIAHQRLVCCGVGEWPVPPGMGKWHQYAILGLKQGHVDLWNPWGSNYNYTPKGPPGLQHGYPTRGGRFLMPIHDFVRIFGAVNVESNLHLH